MNRAERRAQERAKNSNKSVVENVVVENNKNNSQEANQGDNMSNVQAIIDQATKTAQEKIANKTANKSARAVLIKEITKKKNLVNVTRSEALENQTDELVKLELNQHFDMEIKKIDVEYKPQLKALNIYKVEVTEAGAEALVDKITKPLAPATRGLASAFKRTKANLFGSSNK